MPPEPTPGSAAGLGREPFVSFPRWGLLQALADHQFACRACRENRPDECSQAWYLTLLQRKIVEANSGR